MKFLTLTLKENDAIKGYDFVNGEGDLNAEEIKSSLEDVLFGNDALFEGEILFNAEFGEKMYSVKRDFAGDNVEVKCEGEILPRQKADAILSGIAALGKKQWKENLSPIDTEAFLTDCADYLEKRLAAMGFDVEELERRSLSYATERDRALSQVEVLDELVVDESIRTELAANIRRAEELKAEMDAIAEEQQADADYAAAASRSAELNEELSKELAKQDEMDRCAEKLRSNEALKTMLPLYARVIELRKTVQEDEDALRELTSELETAENELNDAKTNAADKKDACDELSQTDKDLRDKFFALLDNGATDEVRAAIMEKMGEKEGGDAVNAYVEWDKKFYDLARDLEANRLDYKTRRSVREGIAFETTMEDLDEQIKVLEDAVASRKNFIAALQNEESTDEDDFLTLYRAKLLYEVYRAEIAAEENKIRENEAAQKKIDEDIGALEKAKDAVKTYVDRANKKCDKLAERLTGVIARKSFCADVTEMEYGAVCPVCNNRITDKTDHVHEIEKLNVTEKKLNEDLSVYRASLAEYSDKSLDINLRLGQLKEKRRLSAVYVDSLIASVGRKQDAVKELLEKTGAKDYADLDKKCAACAKGGDSALAAVLTAKIEEFAPETEALEKRVEELKNTANDMALSYQEEILPELHGDRAYSHLETIIGAEKDEDEKFAALLAADNARSQYLEDLIEGGDPARVITAVNEIFRDALDDIKKNEAQLFLAQQEQKEAERVVSEKKEILKNKIARADELLERIESGKKQAEELCSFASAENVDEETYAALQNDVLTEDQIDSYETALFDHQYKLRSLKAKIAALPKKEGNEKKAEETEDKSTEYAVLSAKIAEEEKILAASDAAFRLAEKKTLSCDELLLKYELTKKLADGQFADVVLPIFNEALQSVGEKATATIDGLKIVFMKKAGKSEKEVAPDGIDEAALAVALHCALNYVTGLACGRDTVRFVSVDKRGEEASVAKKYGVVEL